MIGWVKQGWKRERADVRLSDIEHLLGRAGGRDAVVERMRTLGMGSLADEPLSADRCHRLFGTGELRAMAAKLDLPPRDLVEQLGRLLPRVIGRRAPPGGGEIPADSGPCAA